MAALLNPDDISESGTTSQSKENVSEIFMPRETIDQPCDIVLVVRDCKEFKAHRQVLSQASPFFEELLNSKMKESKEGIISFEMFSESAMGTTLEFIYTGHVQILDEDSARDLIAIADYLFLQELKTLAEGFLLDKHELNTSNCISTYHFCQRYHCEELLIKTKKFILANFTAVYEANREGFLKMSNEEIEMWISSDEIDVSAEEDVFKIILAWIDHDKGKRKKYFGDLLRQVRLLYVSRDILCSDVVTNDLVKENEDCLDLVKEAVRLIDSRNFNNLSVTARKSLESPVIITTSAISLNPDNCHQYTQLYDLDILCYLTRENKWCKLAKMPHEYVGGTDFVYWRGKLYSHGQAPDKTWYDWYETEYSSFPKRVYPLVNYNLYSNCWMTLPYKKDRKLQRVFVANEDEMYAMMSEGFSTNLTESKEAKRVSYIVKYKPESNLWEDISSFDHLSNRHDFCIIAKDHFVYFIGGQQGSSPSKWKLVRDVDRYDLRTNQWDKVAKIQEKKDFLSGALFNGKVFIAGEVYPEYIFRCEVYSEATNQWQFISSFHLKPAAHPELLSVDDKLYVVSTKVVNRGNHDNFEPPDTRVECYDPDKDEWNTKTKVPVKTHPSSQSIVNTYSGRIFKGFLSGCQLKSISSTGNPRKLFGRL